MPRLATRRRRGGTTTGLILMLAIFTGLATTAVVFSPRFAGASGSDAETDTTLQQADNDRQVITRSLASLLGSSRQVLAIHQRESSPYLELVLWVDDRYNRGQIDPSEVAIVAHSRVLQTVSWFSLKPGEFDQAGWEALENTALSPESIETAGFCDRWRSHYAVAPRVVGTGISDLWIRIAQQVSPDTAVLQMTLIWPDNSTDSPTETTAQVHVALRDE